VYPAATTQAATQPATQDLSGGVSFPAWVEKPSLTIGLKDLSLQHAGWPEAINGITGTVSVSPEKIALDKMHATSGSLTADFFATGALKTGAWDFIGTATADKTPREWLSKLPTSIANALSASKPEGSFKLTLNKLNRAAAGQPWTFDASLSAMKLTTSGPLSLGADRLSIVLNGKYDPATVALDASGVLAGTQVSVSGKPIDTLTANIASSAADKSLKITDIDGKVAGGSLQGSIVARLDENARYQADLSLNDAELARLMLPPTATDEDRKKIGTGRVSATLALQQTFGDKEGRGADKTGRGDLIVRDGKIYNVPLAMGLKQLVTLRLPVSRSFDHATMSYYLRDNKVTFERILLESSGINLAGMGTMSMKDSPPTLNLNFVTESPNELHLPLVTDILNLTRSELLQVSVTGSVDDPKITPIPLNPIASTLKALLPKKKEK
jgi:hypothetical protein